MSPFNRDYQLGKHYQNRQLRQARNYDLAKLVKVSRPMRRVGIARVYKPTLFRLGKQLEAIGTSLQIRYGDLKPSHHKR